MAMTLTPRTMMSDAEFSQQLSKRNMEETASRIKGEITGQDTMPTKTQVQTRGEVQQHWCSLAT